MKVHFFWLNMFLVLAGISSCERNNENDPIPYVPFSDEDSIEPEAYFSNASIDEAFKDFPQLLTGLTGDERKVVGFWKSYDNRDYKIKMSGNIDESPYREYVLFPNKIAQIDVFTKQNGYMGLSTLIGLWKVEDGVLKFTIYAISFFDKRFKTNYSAGRYEVTLVTPYTINVIAMDRISPLGYTIYRVQQFSLTDEIIKKLDIKQPRYRPYMYRILRDQYPGMEPEEFSMPIRLRRILDTGKTPEDFVQDIKALKEYLAIKD